MYQVNASLARMYALLVVTLPTVGSPPLRGQGHWSPPGRRPTRIRGPQVPPAQPAWHHAQLPEHEGRARQHAASVRQGEYRQLARTGRPLLPNVREGRALATQRVA
jgi:hypothetical protein